MYRSHSRARLLGLKNLVRENLRGYVGKYLWLAVPHSGDIRIRRPLVMYGVQFWPFTLLDVSSMNILVRDTMNQTHLMNIDRLPLIFGASSTGNQNTLERKGFMSVMIKLTAECEMSSAAKITSVNFAGITNEV